MFRGGGTQDPDRNPSFSLSAVLGSSSSINFSLIFLITNPLSQRGIAFALYMLANSIIYLQFAAEKNYFPPFLVISLYIHKKPRYTSWSGTRDPGHPSTPCI